METTSPDDIATCSLSVVLPVDGQRAVVQMHLVPSERASCYVQSDLRLCSDACWPKMNGHSADKRETYQGLKSTAAGLVKLSLK